MAQRTHTRRTGFFAGIPEGAERPDLAPETGNIKRYTWPKEYRGAFPEVEVVMDYDHGRVFGFYGRTAESFSLPIARAGEVFDWARARWQHVKMTS